MIQLMVGLWIGGIVGVVAMCLFRVNKPEKKTVPMTRLEKTLEIQRGRLIESNCPSQFCVGPKIDDKTRKYNGIVIGCRGITCVECWNKEYKED